ncbi:MAG: asparagine synthase-related protein [Candidatus Acidiferrales bacterium]
MPGITGLITKMPRERAEKLLCRMLRALCHESFYEAGTWIDESLGVYVGWALRKGSFCEGMPVKNERGDITLVFSGQEYSGSEARRELKEKGHSFDERTAEYLVHVYEEDPSFPLSLNGLFHGLVADRTRGTATIFNDRYGMHRICYHESSDAFYFGAEAKAILAACPQLREADLRSLGEFVACSCVLGDRTIFKDIRLLPAASSWVFRDARIERKNTYFRPKEWEDQAPMESEAYYSELRTVFSRNLQLYFSEDEPVGMTLTGGLDTRMIMAWHKSPPGSIPCYTFGGMMRDCEDVRIARRIARVCQQSHEVISIGDEFLSRFPHYAERTVHITEGGVDVYRASDLYVSEKARHIAPAKVVGTYGSEIIRRAVMFKPMAPPSSLFQAAFAAHISEAENTYGELRREHPVTFAAFRQSPWYHQGILALESSQLTVRSPYLDNDFVRTVFRDSQSDASNGDVRLRLINDGSPALGRIPTDRGVGGISGHSFPISRGLMEFTFKAEYAYDYGMPQWASRIDRLLSPFHVERLFLGRHKISHFRIWYRDALSNYVRDMLLDRRTLTRPYLEPRAVEAVVNGHTRGGLNYTTAIHKLLTLELLQRLFFDAN